jgi:glutamate-1-semialdehyde aminotransferase
MSPSITNANEVPNDPNFDLQKWLKEIEGAENLMNEVEAKADTLRAKVDALLLEVGQPLKFEEDTNMSEASTTNQEEEKPSIKAAEAQKEKETKQEE